MRRVVEALTGLAGLAACCITISSVPVAQAQQGGAGDSIRSIETAPLFSSQELLHFTLIADLKQLKKDRSEDSEYRPVRIVLGTAGDTSRTLELKVKTRGVFRLQRRTCDFPPLLLNFPSEATAGTVFDGQDKVKLVTHCNQKRNEYEQYVIQEYLLYRIYNLLTEKSFQVRPAHITYVQVGDTQDSITKYGFLIEDEDQMAARNGAKILDVEGFHQYEMQHDQMTLFSVFQYFIGNADWSVSALHNVKIILDERQNVPIAVPYDFDFAGAIDARYAAPPEELGTGSVRDRVLISHCRTQEEFDRVFGLFRDRKDAVYDLYRNQLGLQEKYTRRALEYFDKFYETIDNPRAVRREFLRGCPRG
ncbi:MAG: hypothetical protein GTN62_12755 [Gemmatimonadales bacterium]|nr:hypothetical protein [Gemmatimonadales bacterium]NIN12680.1 hypothetical protein [Gemmatimonadales bacterium]NIN50960.1 hypothetical protein [Gemmatimonadales bacterium]NIP08424.1 hypothetical protein [Gemmatimonadales bacterium]NIR03608.1 hypothetical protein [Gemmatimonadales bacterium]